MLRPRIIPSLLIQDNGLVKTVNFKNPKYVGDPINAVKIFNEKEVDELAIFDIDATVKGLEPNYSLIERIANQSRMPLCYGGGVKTVEQAQKIFGLGIEKIALSSAVIENPDLITKIADRVGAQSVIVVLDVKKKLFGGYEVYTHNGKKSTGINPFKFIEESQNLGAGEIVINSIDQDGVMKGYDISLIDKAREKTSLPMTVLGGAGSLEDIKKIIDKHEIIGVAAGSLFVFKGKYKAVLINYPLKEEKDNLLRK
ncbi:MULTISPECIES: AglZ/HisF2 family acetamidino modification protein [Elizabethkingia]|jgi:cyclase|uniref:AglZ/HisF2 family acetamidino modification protein n=1 Tax=Elizabethkingia TaxID=308865 RepID=UPI0009991C32|nr:MULTISPECIES: AglZ/HisF2 family acetamidino modification protein [Elizabethkingia]MCT4223078.1 imidazole glycerol phosphate synthase subunit HisF [Elizabethkingia anophelis]MCT4330847.1 imidazole glycerol phosphate synthase subunit HisF [Elizabethkingia anophelis]MDV3865666.1 imidazole glycerol phosphate synthase cyclase subunit [Elizabethkingia anophelis]MEC4712243.1 AglZ/HisF2 family acetamidino modification protein [Elizabethkingia meningoseptica]MYY26429.1 imidazole glycerol phosphate s